MCGIAGCLERRPHPARDRTVVKMIQTLSHRGPDGQGFWKGFGGRVHLGHCRLSIVDLSPTGGQPMASGDGRYLIVFNGEIYNYVELRQELAEAQIQFRGTSDTEILLEGIAHWGLAETLNRLVGMFAFGLWDNVEKRLVLVRDRVGKKPLYYLTRKDSFFFASELKALNGLGQPSLTLDEDSVYQYLTFGFVPAPRTIYKEAAEVPAGHYVTICSELDLKSQAYWTLPLDQKRQITFAEALEEAEQTLRDAVKIRLRADVPVGCFLSGGIDSGLLTALASLQLTQPLKTFTVSFKEASFDESPLANLVAQRYGTEHHVMVLSPNLAEVLPKIAQAYDEPLADASIIPSYCIAQEARKLLKVVLIGDGGDELFGGYRRQLAMKWFSQMQGGLDLIPESLWRRLANLLPQPKAFRSRYAFTHRFVRGMVRDPFERYIAWCVDGFTEAEKVQLYSERGKHRRSSTRLLREKFGALLHLHPLDHFMAMDFLLNMHDDMLVKIDIATMAHGLEGRNPFLDHRLVEFAQSLPPAVRLRGFTTKPILRELAKKYLPPEVAGAPKRGFEVPLISWLRHDLFESVYDTCLAAGGIVTSLFNRTYVEDLLFERLDLDPDRWSKRVFTLFMLALWEKANR